ATKLPHQQCRSYEDFDRIFVEQCKRLKTDYIDYYLIHNLSDLEAWDLLKDAGIEHWIAEKKQNGQIRNIGFSFHGTQASFLELLDAYDWEFCQIQYNYMNENYQAGRKGLLKAHAKGLPVIVMEPLLGGKLATALPPKAAKTLKAADAARSPAGWALSWLWNQPEVTCVLSGMNSAEQLTDNLAIAETATVGCLTAAEHDVIESVKSVFEEAYPIPCTGCNYCMPCHHKVNIPGCFAAYNTAHAIGFVAGMTQYLTSSNAIHPKSNTRVSNCVHCGLCEQKCPQHIAIMDGLDEARRRLEPFWFGAAMKIARLVTGTR
ncbi:MAG: aldo/keto reductase, partial [Clostridiales Family XIII bacterium]|nr:aldo/keto reductase [Clostridiales Family XIII bacterium]